MFKLHCVGHYLQEISEGEDLPNLKPLLAAVCEQRVRRIDRFIQLALLGVGRCNKQQRIGEDVSIYIGSGTGAVGNNVVVQKQLQQGQLPKPFNFVNTLGSSTGYYVANSLGLPTFTQNQFVSRRHYTLQALLALVETDMQLGLCKQALVGVVEECALPLAEHRRRQGIEAIRPVAEGSHWFLLSPADDMKGNDSENLGAELAISRFNTAAALLDTLVASWQEGDCYAAGSGIEANFSQQLIAKIPAAIALDIKLPFHDSPDAALLAAFTCSDIFIGNKGRLQLISGSDENGWYLMCCG
jgi:hypothetical protein